MTSNVLLGMTLEAFQEFFKLCGGESLFYGLSTAEVCSKFIIPMTRSSRKSYCDLMYFRSEGKIQQAKIFISHCWMCNFLEMYYTIQQYLKHTKTSPSSTTAVWLDLFSYNQHLEGNNQSEFIRTTFSSVIEKIGYTIMVLTPWDDPKPLTRTWCLYELFCTIQTKDIHFEIAMTTNEKTRFINDICQKGSDEVNKMLSIVSVQRSQCSKIDDQLCIFQLVQDKFHEINSEVFHLIRKWIIKTMKEELIHCSDLSINRSTLLFANATITYSFGLLNESEEYYKEYNRLHFDSLEHWLKGLNGLALLYRDQAKYQDAFELYNNGIREISDKFGCSHHLIVEATSQLAMLHRYCGNYKEAARILESCLIVMKENIIGTSIQSFIENKLKYYLACVYSDDKKLHESEKLFLGCYEFNVHYIGENNPDTLAMMDDFALLYRRLERYSDSVNIYERCVMKRKEKLGNDHPDTLASMSGLASVYCLQKRYDLALELACDTLMKRRTKLGYDHPVTINTYGNIGMIKFEASNGRCNCKVHCDYLFSDSIGNCGKYMIVEVIEELKRRNYPDDHTWILKFKKVLEKCVL